MCGRFALENVGKIFIRFNAENTVGVLAPRYNIAPGQETPVVIRKSPNKVVMMRWGLIPIWAKDPKIGYKMINARVESISAKPSFRIPFKKKRCIIPADGFYEWWKIKSVTPKMPYFIKFKESPLFGFAGLYDEWKNENGKLIYSFTIITVPANSLVAQIHDRMPAILNREDEVLWLDKEFNDEKKLLSMLKPHNPEKMKTYQVSMSVNKANLDIKELIEPIKHFDSSNFKKSSVSARKLF